MTPEEIENITDIRKDTVDAITGLLGALTRDELNELIEQELAESDPRTTLIAATEKALGALPPVDETDSNPDASTDTTVSEAEVAAKAEEDKAKAEAEAAAKAEEDKAKAEAEAAAKAEEDKAKAEAEAAAKAEEDKAKAEAEAAAKAEEDKAKAEAEAAAKAEEDTDAEKEAAAAKAKEVTTSKRKAAMINLDYMKPDYSGPITSQIVEARRRFKGEFDESPWEAKVQTK